MAAHVNKPWAWGLALLLVLLIGFQTDGPIEKRALRYAIELIGIIILWFGLGQVFLDGETVRALFLRCVRYLLVGFWVTAGAPWLFFHFNLVRQPKM